MQLQKRTMVWLQLTSMCPIPIKCDSFIVHEGNQSTTAGIGSVSTRPLSSSTLHVCGNLVMQMELGYLTRLFDELFSYRDKDM